MAVLIEALSVVIKRTVIEDKFPEGWEGFVSDVPNGSLCADDELVRVGFMSPDDVETYIKHIEQHGIHYLDDGVAQDAVVADQRTGFLAPCDWAEFGHIDFDGDSEMKVAACRASGSTLMTILTPDGWKYEGSLSQTFSFTPRGQLEKSLTFLRHEDGVDVYLNKLTGKEAYIGRTGDSMANPNVISEPFNEVE